MIVPQPGAIRSGTMPIMRAAGMTLIIWITMMGGGAVAQAVRAAQNAPQISVAAGSIHELAFIKAELEALQAMVLLSPKVTPELQEQIAVLKLRLAAALSLDAASSSSKQPLVPVRDSARPLEVNVT